MKQELMGWQWLNCYHWWHLEVVVYKSKLLNPLAHLRN